MNTEFAQFPLENGGTIVVEVAERPGVARISRGGTSMQQATSTFQHALKDVHEAASAVLDQFQTMPRRPDSVEISFGLNLDAQIGAVFARGGIEASFQVTLRWAAES